MKNLIIMVWQLISYFVIGIPLRIIFKIRLNANYIIDKNKCYILVANHLKKTDPFLISYSIPLKDSIKLIPIRFITTEKYMKNIFLRPFLLLCGCISTKQKYGKSILKKSILLLNKGETIFIFPSGRLQKDNKKYKIKVGANYLEREVKNSLILPVKINYNKNYVDIRIKNPFRHSYFPEDLQPLADKTYNKILN